MCILFRSSLHLCFQGGCSLCKGCRHLRIHWVRSYRFISHWSVSPPSLSPGKHCLHGLIQPHHPGPGSGSCTPYRHPPTPAGPATPPSVPSSMDVDMPELLGYKSDSIDHVFLGGRADSLNQDFKAVTTSLDAITDLLNWTTANQHTIVPSSADDLCSHLMPLIDTICDLGLLKCYLSHDNETGTRHFSVGSSVSRLISTPGIVAFTTVLEALQAAKEKQTAPPPAVNKPKAKLVFRPGRVPSNITRPPPVPHSTRPPCPTSSKLASVRAESDSRPQTWTPVTNKQKAPNQEETIIALVKTFPASTSVTIQQTATTIACSSSFGGSYNESKFKIRKSTTLGRLRKQVTVFTSPLLKWAEDVVYNQINGCLDNTKRLIQVMSVESRRGGLSRIRTILKSSPLCSNLNSNKRLPRLISRLKFQPQSLVSRSVIFPIMG